MKESIKILLLLLVYFIPIIAAIIYKICSRVKNKIQKEL